MRVVVALLAFASAGACAEAVQPASAPLSVHVAGRGPRCLVIPGGPGLDGRYLRMPELEKRLTLVYLDLAGTGGTPGLSPSAKYSVRRDARDVDAARATLGIENACLIGHSYGGVVAERYAIDHPGRVGTLVLYDATARDGREFHQALLENAKWFSQKSWFPDALAALTAGTRAPTDAAASEKWATMLPLYFADFDARRAEYERASRVPAYADVARRRDDPPSFDLRKELSSVRARTLVLVGKRDFIASEPFAREIAGAIPRAKLVVFQRSGHMAHLEEPEVFASTVAEFVEEK